jgi:hypothetical protein
MAQAFNYHVMRDPDGWGWIITAEGYAPHSLPYDTMEQAIFFSEELVRQHPGSTLVVNDQPPALSPVEMEHRITA